MPHHLRRMHPLRLVGSLALGLLLLYATLHNKALYALYALLDAEWHRAVVTLGLAHRLPGVLLPGGPILPLMREAHSVPAVLLYSVCYIGLCLAIIFLLVSARRERRQVLLFYGGAGLAAALLLLGSKAGGGGPVLAALASQLLHFIVSPLPVITLVPLLRWSASQELASSPSYSTKNLPPDDCPPHFPRENAIE